MIVKMEKITLLVTNRSQEDALKRLRKLGVVHINFTEEPISEDINSLVTKINNLDKALSITDDVSGQKLSSKSSNNKNYDKTYSYAQEIVSLYEEKTDLLQKLEELNEQYKWFQTWGNIKQSSIQKLRESSIFIKLYICSKNFLKDIPEDKVVHVIREDKKSIYIAVIMQSEDDRLPLPEEELPKEELSDIEDAISNTTKRIEAINKSLKSLAEYKKNLIQYKNEISKNLEFCKVKDSMLNEEGFLYLEGFCPKESLPQLHGVAEEEGWGVINREPEDPNEVPTLIRNPRWLRIINPIFKFMGTLPGYNEYDVSFWFLLFFSLFFAMIISDGGYGLLLILLGIFLRKKLKKAPREPFVLLYVLAGATVIWGAITGTWFGSETIARLPFFNYFIIDQINSFVDTSQGVLILICFIIGAVHLSMAHLTTAFHSMRSLSALAEIGWVLVIWTLFFVAGNMILSRPLPEFTFVLFISGISMILLFTNFQKNVLKGILFTLKDLPLSIISSFSDLVSYIRLFAVGYASVIVSSSFNKMAIGAGIDNFGAGIVAVLVLFFGHALNIILCLMAVIVHGIRLNMLEFSGHVNMQWSGREYNPFKE